MDFNDTSIINNHAKCFEADCPELWVFGYGSLLWKPAFPYNSRQVGYIKNYARRFNQENTTFRGTPDKPGLVANLEKKDGNKVWGEGFQVCGRKEVLDVLRNLYKREISCGGYDIKTTSFYMRDRRQTAEEMRWTITGDDFDDDDDWNDEAAHHPKEVVEVLMFTPTQDNALYVGPDTIPNKARQIVQAKGNAGSNAEYVLNTADYIRKFIPEDDDQFLFELEAKIKEFQRDRDLQSSRLDSNDVMSRKG